MDRHIIFDRARRYLAAELGCLPEELSGSGTLYVQNDRARQPYLKLAAIGERVIVSASPELLPGARRLRGPQPGRDIRAAPGLRADHTLCPGPCA